MRWYQPQPAESLDLIEMTGVAADEAVIDIGGGASTLVDGLIAAGYRDVSVLDISSAGMRGARERLKDSAAQVRWLHQDLLSWQPDTRLPGVARQGRIPLPCRPRQPSPLPPPHHRCRCPWRVRRRGHLRSRRAATLLGPARVRHSVDELRAALGDNLELVTWRRVSHSPPQASPIRSPGSGCGSRATPSGGVSLGSALETPVEHDAPDQTCRRSGRNQEARQHRRRQSRPPLLTGPATTSLARTEVRSTSRTLALVGARVLKVISFNAVRQPSAPWWVRQVWELAHPLPADALLLLISCRHEYRAGSRPPKNSSRRLRRVPQGDGAGSCPCRPRWRRIAG